MTPAVDIAKKQLISFTTHQYLHDANANAYGEEAADKLGVPYEQVFKTLLVTSAENELAVAIVPVSAKLSLKKMAKVLAWKKVVMADKQVVSRATGYVIGGVSPLGQKKAHLTVIDEAACKCATIFVSAGKRGLEIELSPHDLAHLSNARFADIAEHHIRPK